MQSSQSSSFGEADAVVGDVPPIGDIIYPAALALMSPANRRLFISYLERQIRRRARGGVPRSPGPLTQLLLPFGPQAQV